MYRAEIDLPNVDVKDLAGTTLTVMAAVVTIAAALGVVWGIWRWVSGTYRRTIGSRRDLRHRLDELACGTTQEYVEQRLGPPAIRRLSPMGQLFPTSGLQLTECVYRMRHALVQVLYDEAGAAVVISVTVDDPRFDYPAGVWTWQHCNVKIGKSRFSELSDELLQGRRYEYGANRGHFAEHHYWGNPAAYQNYIFAFNDAGTGPIAHSPSFVEGSQSWAGGVKRPRIGSRPQEQALGELRAGTTINTLVIIGPQIVDPVPFLSAWPGVDYNHVRTLLWAERRGEMRRQSEPQPVSVPTDQRVS